MLFYSTTSHVVTRVANFKYVGHCITEDLWDDVDVERPVGGCPM